MRKCKDKLFIDFLADVWVTCPVCEGHRFNRETLGVKFKDKSIADVLEMDIATALDSHLCRCGAHARILGAIERAAGELNGGGQP